MPPTLQIPADAIPAVRLAVLTRLGDATDQMSQVLARPGHEHNPDWLTPARILFEELCLLLDQVGWDATLPPEPATIDLTTHGHRLRDAIERYLPLLENWRDESALDHNPPPGPTERAKHEQHAHSAKELQALLVLIQAGSDG